MLLGKAQSSMLSYQLDKNGRTLCLNHFWTTYAYVHSHTPKNHYAVSEIFIQLKLP